MRKDAIKLEETRLQGIKEIEDYPDFHERHRVFPAIFENRQHRRILDLASGVGCVAQRVHKLYSASLVSNDISYTCLRILSNLGIPTAAFDLDDSESAFPFPDGYFDAVITLATIEHLIHLENFVNEIYRVLGHDGYLYISSPNYASIIYLPRYILRGESFHDPLSKSSRVRYEFFAHVRYFTYNTLLNYISSFGFAPDTVYLPVPGGSTRYRALYATSKPKALIYKSLMWTMYSALSPRWASEPIICFQKNAEGTNHKFRKVLL